MSKDFEQVKINKAANCCEGCVFDSHIYIDDCYRPKDTTCSGADTILRPITPEGVAIAARARLGIKPEGYDD